MMAFMTGPTRRQLLGAGAFGSAILALGAIGLGVQGGADHPVPQLAAFDPTAFRTLQSLAARTCPGSLPGFPSAADVNLAEHVDAYAATLHETDQKELNQALWLLENGLAGFLTAGRAGPFTTASAAAQDATLHAWRDSSVGVLRRAYKALTAMCIGTYYALPEVQKATGYPGPPDYGQAEAPAIQPVQVAEVPA